MSPDGRHLYVALGDEDGDSISAWTRNKTTGALTFADCKTTNDDFTVQCDPTNQGFLDNPIALAISPDGDEVFIAGENQSSIGSFARNEETGELGTVHCLGGAPECADVVDPNALLGPSALAVSRDGRFIYAAARGGDAIAWFGYNNATGQLEYKDCYGATSAGGCVSIGNSHALNGPAWIAVSPDNAQLFVAARDGNAIATFNRNRTTGALSFGGCDGTTNQGPCAPIANGNALSGPEALAISPAGGRLYAAAASGNAVASFARRVGPDPLALLGCIGANASGPCTSSGNTTAFSSPEAIAASPDGRHLYVAAGGSGALTVLGVARPACSPVSALTPFNTAIRVRLVCGDPDGGDAVRFSVARPANGTLSQLDAVRGTVVFTPNPGFSGQGVFDFTASDADGSTTARATIGVGQRPVVPRRPRTRRLDPPVQNRWAYTRTHTWILRLRVRRVPGDAKVQVRCKAPKRLGRKACPFKRKSAKPKRHGATVDVRKLFGERTKLRVGVRIQIRITAPGAIGKVVTYKLRPKKIPKSTGRCLAPGASKPTKC